MTDFRSYAAEYDDAHDTIDDEHEVLKGMFDRLRTDLRADGRDKTEVQQLMGQFKELMAARRKFGPTLDGYMAKSERIDHFNVEIFGGLIPTAAKKRTSDNPKPDAGPSDSSLARARGTENGGGVESRHATRAKASGAPRSTGALMPEGNTGEGQAGVAPSPPDEKPKGQSAEHNARSAPVAAVGGEGSGDRGPTAATNSNAPAISAPSDSRAAATSNIGVAATVSEPIPYFMRREPDAPHWKALQT